MAPTPTESLWPTALQARSRSSVTRGFVTRPGSGSKVEDAAVQLQRAGHLWVCATGVEEFQGCILPCFGPCVTSCVCGGVPCHSFASPGLPLTAISGPAVREDQVWYGLNTGQQLSELFLPFNDFAHYEWTKRPLALLTIFFKLRGLNIPAPRTNADVSSTQEAVFLCYSELLL